MEAEAYDRVSGSQRAAIVAAAAAADMVINFPLWIAAKRISASLPLPSLSFSELYKGSGSLYVAMGPMMVVEDRATAVALGALDGRIGPEAAHAASACFAGVVGGLCIGAQVEGTIVRAHSTSQTVLQAARSTFASGGLLSLLAPYGALMIACREMPYAGCLFFLSGRIRDRVRGAIGGDGASRPARLAGDVASAAMTAAVAGPLSHPPSVVAAHQAAHAVSLPAACAAIMRSGGRAGFFAGLLPRTISLTGSLFVMPFTIEALQPWVERWHSAA